MLDSFKEKKGTFLLIVLVVGIILGLIISMIINRRETEPKVQSQTSVRLDSVSGETDVRNAFIKVADQVGPAVVSVYTETTHKIAGRRFGMRPNFGRFQDKFFNDFFDEFFKDIPQREYKQTGLGSGVIIDQKGYILTNEHVIKGADKITVALADGREFKGAVKGTDPKSDLAVIKIDAKNLPTAELGDSGLMQIGEWVVAIGNPFGYVMRSPKPTVTAGVVSALHRSLPRRLPGYTDLIQTDAAINPGNSGGPLCNLNGKVIGINVAIFSQSGGFQGVGFAIPSNYVKEVLADLIEGKEVQHGWLGVSVQDLTQDLADYFGIENRQGVLIAGVLEDGPAEKGGLKEGDIIKTFNKKDIKDVNELLRVISLTKVGKQVKIVVVRDKNEKTFNVKIGKRPAEIDKLMPGGAEIESKEEASWRGMTVANITNQIANQLSLKDKIGVVVINVEAQSDSSNAGIKRADVIREVDRRKVSNVKEFEKIIKGLKGDILLRLERGYVIIKEE